MSDSDQITLVGTDSLWTRFRQHGRVTLGSLAHARNDPCERRWAKQEGGADGMLGFVKTSIPDTRKVVPRRTTGIG